jgi:hypothetical protein
VSLFVCATVAASVAVAATVPVATSFTTANFDKHKW